MQSFLAAMQLLVALLLAILAIHGLVRQQLLELSSLEEPLIR